MTDLRRLTVLIASAAWFVSADWEWSGVFSLDSSQDYVWSASRGDGGSYADPAMKMVVSSVSDATEAAVEAVEPTVQTQWDVTTSNWTVARGGDTISLSTSCVSSYLTFDADSWVTLFHLDATATGNYAFFCEHHPIEFEKEFHYLKDKEGNDIEPEFEEVAGAESEEDGGMLLAVGGSFLSTLPAGLAMLFVGPGMTKLGVGWINRLLPFTSGAISSCAFFLLLPEALHLTSDGQDEATGIWTWGTSALLGWLACVLMHHLVAVAGKKSGKDDAEAAENGEGDEKTEGRKKSFLYGKWQVALPVLLGDAVHGVVDGVLIGFSAKHCSNSMTWGIIAATVGHEAPQEISDFVILMTKAGMDWKLALITNFVAAQGAILGGIIGYAAEMSNNVQGLALSFCGGIFLFISISELSPHLMELKDNKALDSAMVIGLFALGATLIGLVLLNHEHCVAGGGGHGHGGH